MPERDVATEVLKGLREVWEHRTGRRALRERQVEATPLPELSPEVLERIRENIEGSEEAVTELTRSFSAHQSATGGSGPNGGFDTKRFTARLKDRGALRDGDGIER